MRARLVGHDVGHDAALEQRAEHLAGRSPTRPIERPSPGRARLLGLAQRGVEVGRDEVEVARLDAALEAVRVDVDDQADAVEHRRRRAAGRRPCRRSRRSARAGRAACRRSACARPPRTSRTCPAGCPGCRCRSTSRPSSGRTSSAPRPRAAGTSPSRPSRARAGEFAISTRGAISCVRKTPTGLPLCTSSVSSSLEPAQRRDDRVERLPRARGAPRAAVDDEVGGILGDLGVEVVHEHAQRGLLQPALAAELGAARRADDGCVASRRVTLPGGRTMGRRGRDRSSDPRRARARRPRRRAAPLADDARARLVRGRETVDAMVAEGAVVYGVTTGLRRPRRRVRIDAGGRARSCSSTSSARTRSASASRCPAEVVRGMLLLLAEQSLEGPLGRAPRARRAAARAARARRPAGRAVAAARSAPRATSRRSPTSRRAAAARARRRSAASAARRRRGAATRRASRRSSWPRRRASR